VNGRKRGRAGRCASSVQVGRGKVSEHRNLAKEGKVKDAKRVCLRAGFTTRSSESWRACRERGNSAGRHKPIPLSSSSRFRGPPHHTE